MGIVRFDPFRELDRLQNEVNRLFEGYTRTPEQQRSSSSGDGSAMAPYQGRVWSPSVDVAETQTEILLRAELPGMRQEDIDIELSGDTLTLRGERKFENEEKRENYVRVERSYGRFQRSFTLGVPVKFEEVTANYRDGILEVRLPKSDATRPRKVQVTGGAASSNANRAMTGSSNSDASAPQQPQQVASAQNSEPATASSSRGRKTGSGGSNGNQG
jgi:HSP20 family protein